MQDLLILVLSIVAAVSFLMFLREEQWRSCFLTVCFKHGFASFFCAVAYGWIYIQVLYLTSAVLIWTLACCSANLISRESAIMLQFSHYSFQLLFIWSHYKCWLITNWINAIDTSSQHNAIALRNLVESVPHEHRIHILHHRVKDHVKASFVWIREDVVTLVAEQVIVNDRVTSPKVCQPVYEGT